MIIYACHQRTLMNNQLSEADCLKPVARSTPENLENHHCDACFRPYADLCKRQTTFGGKGSLSW